MSGLINGRAALPRDRFVLAPGVWDLMSLKFADRHGFDALYVSGFWMTASRTGLPDVGVASYTEFVDGLARMAEHTATPLIVDADTGFGGLLNVRRTVQGYERAGAAAIQIEDQEFPKKCGHTPHKRLVPTADMVTKIQVALEARQSDDFLIIARTDARQGEGLQAAIDRAAAYGEAGADWLFVEAPASEEEMRAICAALPTPNVVNMASGGMTPLLPQARLEALGYTAAILPASPIRAALATINAGYARLKANGGDAGALGLPEHDFQDVLTLMGFPDVWAFESRWGRYSA
jgi:2-methylisocitrate lyase-like PEP mutase family enzyme